MSGADTVRGIAYQQAQGVLAAVEVVASDDLGSVRVEGIDDAVDIEKRDRDGVLRHAMQVKVRAPQYTWGREELLKILRGWAALPDAAQATFEFLTDGRLGPTGDGVKSALDEATAGQLQPLADLLGVGVEDPVVLALKKARIRRDAYDTGALLARAESQVAAMLPHARTEEDTRQQAINGIDRLFRALFQSASDPDESRRIMDRRTIARHLGVPPEQAPAERWGALRCRYLAKVAVPDFGGVAAQPLNVIRERAAVGDEGAPVSELLNVSGPVMLVGPTGTGKTTACRMLRHQAAENGRVVVVAHAETYLPGRLAALVADGLASVMREPCPTATGVQALSDRSVTLIIDGASEVADTTQQALGQELLAPVSADHGARVVLVGRDVTALRSMLPSSLAPAVYGVKSLQHDQKLELATEIARSAPNFGMTEVRAAVARINDTLADAAGSPMLFSMAMDLYSEGAGLGSKADIYRTFLDLMAERTGARGPAVMRMALGMAYAGLLDQGRRSADPFEWQRLLDSAAQSLSAIGMLVEARAVNDAARRCGLVTSLGWAQTVVPVHDSFADYLAGVAHAGGAAPLPGRFNAGDDQRILFSAEIGGVTDALATTGTRDLPFSMVAMAEFDRRAVGEDAPEQVAFLLTSLFPVSDQGIVLSRLDDGRILAMQRHEPASGWLDAPSAIKLMASLPAVVVEQARGPLAVAVRLWRQILIASLRRATPNAPGQSACRQAAAEALTARVAETALAVRRLFSQVAPPGHAERLISQVGLLGIDAMIGPREMGPMGPHTPVIYRQSESTTVRTVTNRGELDRHRAGMGGSTTLEYLLDGSPASVAVERVRKAIEALTAESWLAM
ncbi:ATP-binding protein [Streptomyces parvus]